MPMVPFTRSADGVEILVNTDLIETATPGERWSDSAGARVPKTTLRFTSFADGQFRTLEVDESLEDVLEACAGHTIHTALNEQLDQLLAALREHT